MVKRKRVTKVLDEADRNLYNTFSNAANAVSQLYTQVSAPHGQMTTCHTPGWDAKNKNKNARVRVHSHRFGRV